MRRLSIYAFMALVAVMFAPEILDAGNFVLAKSIETNALRIIDGVAIATGCF